jgi:hypothetical protein
MKNVYPDIDQDSLKARQKKNFHLGCALARRRAKKR